MRASEAPNEHADRGYDQPEATQEKRFWAMRRVAIALMVTAGCVVAVTTGWVSPVRAVLALAFLLFCPGLALAELLEIDDVAQLLTIAIAGSLALDTLLALVLVYSGAFSAPLAVDILAAVTVAALITAVLRAARRAQLSETMQRSET